MTIVATATRPSTQYVILFVLVFRETVLMERTMQQHATCHVTKDHEYHKKDNQYTTKVDEYY